MNNNYNPYQQNNQYYLPKPSFSGTIGQDTLIENRDDSDEINGQNDFKRQRINGPDNMSYAYNTTQNSYQPPQNRFYSQPYMHGNINHQFSQSLYGLPYNQHNHNTMNTQQQQSYHGYSQGVYNNSSTIPPSNSALISYEDMYSSKDTKAAEASRNNSKKPTSAYNKTNTSKIMADTPLKAPIIEKPKSTVPAVDNRLKNDPENTSQPDNIDSDSNADTEDVGKDNTTPSDTFEEIKASDIVTVPGTSIALVTEEDIAKWREERKKMWLLKISNRKEQHREAMGIKTEDISKMGNPLKETKKERQFIQNIQNQVNRFNPKVNLNLKIVQREMMEDNTKILSFIKELGDAGLLEYELSEKEKSILFKNQDDNNNRSNNRKSDRFRQKQPRYNNNNTNRAPNNNKNNGGNWNYKNYTQ